MIDVVVEGKTHVVTKEDFQSKNYPFRSNVRSVLKYSDIEKPSKNKVFVIRNDELTEVFFTKDSVNTSEDNQIEIG